MKYPAYPKYKPSGIEWLGDVPEHWEVKKVTYGFKKIGSGTTPKSDSVEYYDGNIPWVTTSELRESIILESKATVTNLALSHHSSLHLYPIGTLLFAMYGATIGRLGILGISATVNQACCAFAFPVLFETRFIYYWLWIRRPILIALASGGGQPNLSQDDLRQVRIPIPSLLEQRTIVNFLDTQTAKLDILTAKKRELIEKLKEKRTALISSTVTRGLPPEVARVADLPSNYKFKPSGIEWLDEVPIDWLIVAVKRMAKPGRKTFTDGDWIETPFITDEGIRLIQTGNVGIGKYKEQGFRFISEDTFSSLRCTEVHPNDVLICRLDGPVGRACLVPEMGLRMITSVDNTILKVKNQIEPRLIVRFMSSTPWLSWIDTICRAGGGFRFRISRAMLGEQKILIPSLQEQRAIADYLDRETAKIDRMIEKIEAAIEKLQEYRTALITAAVTGKIDVREVLK